MANYLSAEVSINIIITFCLTTQVIFKVVLNYFYNDNQTF